MPARFRPMMHPMKRTQRIRLGRNFQSSPKFSMLVAAGLLVSGSALATTYQVGPAKQYKKIQDVEKLLKAGDVVEVDGNATYPGGVFFQNSGTAAQKITIRGIAVNGKRPVLTGDGGSAKVPGLGLTVYADHYLVEGLEITGAASSCVIHKGDDLTIRDSVVHDCAGHGLLSNDDEAGSLLLDRVEFYKTGQGDRRHQIYVTTSQDTHPGSVFRMENCYVHDGNGGNNVKSRAERNEIYYNWIEGAYYHQLELIGPDVGEITPKREDSDVVGNVIVGTSAQKWHVVRIGGDTEETATRGRYRFYNNTFLMEGNSSVIRVFGEVESISAYNNVFHQRAGNTAMFSLSSAIWSSGTRVVTGNSNFVTASGFSGIPAAAEWANPISGADPGFTNLATLDLRPIAGSILLDKGQDAPTELAGHEMPSPLLTPTESPQRAIAALVRPLVGKRDLGAYEFGSGPPATAGGTPGGGTPGGSGGTADGGVPAGGSSGGSAGGGSSGGSSGGSASGGGTTNGNSPGGEGQTTFSGGDEASGDLNEAGAQGCSTSSSGSSSLGGMFSLVAAVMGVMTRRRRAKN